MVNYSTLKKPDFVRYLLLKGNTAEFSVEKALSEYGQLQARGNRFTYTFQRAEVENRVLVRFPAELAAAHYAYHNILYWFLGSGPDDPKGAAESVGISIDPDHATSYVLYNDYDLRGTFERRPPFSDGELELQVADSLFGVFQSNDKFVLNIPFETYTVVDEEQLPDFDVLLRSKGINMDDLAAGDLKWTTFDVVFNERLH